MAQVTRIINTVLAAVDFTEDTGYILSWSATVCRMTGARLAVVHVIARNEIDSVRKAMDVKGYSEFDLSVFLLGEQGLRRVRMEELFKWLDLDPARISSIVDFGRPVEVILNTVASEKADLLVFGSKGSGGLSRFCFGSVAEKLFRHCPVPVMSLRPGLAASGTKAFAETLAPAFDLKDTIP